MRDTDDEAETMNEQRLITLTLIVPSANQDAMASLEDGIRAHLPEATVMRLSNEPAIPTLGETIGYALAVNLAASVLYDLAKALIAWRRAQAREMPILLEIAGRDDVKLEPENLSSPEALVSVLQGQLHNKQT